MASGDERIRFLVKGKGPAASGHFAFGAGARNIAFTSQPLFRSIGAAGGLAAAASPSQWFLVTAEAGVDSESPWDACHALMAQGQGVAAGGVEFVEPDLLQRWMVEPRPPGASPFALRAGELHKQNPDFPTIPANDLWFRDAQHGPISTPASIRTIAPGRHILTSPSNATSSMPMRPTTRTTVLPACSTR
jgi:hypothetical protein